MPRKEHRFEEVAGQRLPLGGVNGYAGVRGKQGKKKDKYQGCTPHKKHRTDHYDTPLEAAIAFAQLREDLDLGMLDEPRSKKAKSPKTNATYKKKVVGVYLGHLLQLPRPPSSNGTSGGARIAGHRNHRRQQLVTPLMT